MTSPHSDCCGSDFMNITADEGTGYCLCLNCRNPCTPVYPPDDYLCDICHKPVTGTGVLCPSIEGPRQMCVECAGKVFKLSSKIDMTEDTKAAEQIGRAKDALFDALSEGRTPEEQEGLRDTIAKAPLVIQGSAYTATVSTSSLIDLMVRDLTKVGWRMKSQVRKMLTELAEETKHGVWLEASVLAESIRVVKATEMTALDHGINYAVDRLIELIESKLKPE
jgi:hypothetical protein